MKKTYFLIILFSTLSFSQTVQERKRIEEKSNKEANLVLKKNLLEKETARKIRVANYLHQNPLTNKIIRFGENGIKELFDVLPNGEPLYISTENSGSAITARANKLYNGGGLGLNIQGQTMTAGVWDGGSIRFSHQEFMVGGTSKVSVLDGAAVASHATHVGGTIAAQGINPDVRGLAFNSSLKSYDWTNDVYEMLAEASTGMLVSNHSYGPALTTTNQLWILGAYTSDAKDVDELCYNNPFYLPVYAAGNDRAKFTTVPYNSHLTSKQGFDLIGGDAVGKNVLTVAAVYQVDNYAGPGDVLMSSFSNYGPTDDARIKPEISMKGVDVLSTTSASDTSIGYSSGTSMAAPGVTGVVLLLQQYYNQLYSNYMRAATVKGLIMHTADEAGSYDGPDYSFGWGLINAENSAKAIRDKNLVSNRSIIEENTLTNGATFTKQISANGTSPMRISISWTDPQYPIPNSGDADPSTKYLVNDLDIKVTSTSGTIYYPWKLSGLSGVYNPPTNTSTNDVDNFERVDIPLPSGSYTITVTHKGNLTGGNQKFSLIATGGNIATLNTNNSILKENEIAIYPNPTSNWIYFKNNHGEKADVIVLDMSGRLVKKESVENGKISVEELDKGQYMLLYSDTKEREKAYKFIKK